MKQEIEQRRKQLQRDVDALRSEFDRLHRDEKEMLDQVDELGRLAEMSQKNHFRPILTDIHTSLVRVGTALTSAHLDVMIPPTAYQNNHDQSPPLSSNPD